jgi:hypothetical protein
LTIAPPALATTVSFSPSVGYPTGDGPLYFALGDVNKDSKTDVVVPDFLSDDISVLLGDGAGGFGAPTSFAVGDKPEQVALGDLNGDSNLDAVVANFGSDNISILLGDGFGGFGPQTLRPAGGTDLHYIALGDLDNDGDLDIVDGHTITTSVVSVLLGNGSGGFSPAVNFAAGDIAGLVVVDVNGDSNLDVVAGDYQGRAAIVLLGDGTGSFSPVTSFPLIANGNPVSAWYLAVGDLNNDGKLDLAISIVVSFGVSGILTMLGDGAGGFSTHSSSEGGGAVQIGVALGDVDGDGDLDTAMGSDAGNVVWLGDGLGGMSSPYSFIPGSAALEFVDLDGDSDLDIVSAEPFTDVINVSLNTTNHNPSATVVSERCLSPAKASALIEFRVTDPDSPSNTLTMSAKSNNQALVPNSGLMLGGTAVTRTLSLTAKQNKSGTALISVTLSDGLDATTLQFTVIVGTKATETILGTAGMDAIFGMGGHDDINGEPDTDLLCGSKSAESLFGHDGDDTLYGWQGDDSLGGGNDNDTLLADKGNDFLTGGPGADFFSGGPGVDTNTDFTPTDGDTTDGS